MQGTPVWLASVSHESKTTDKFLATERAEAKALLLRVLDGVGNPKRQRFFRMCVTTCLQRAVTDEELARLPQSFHEAEAIDIAGGPVEILEETTPGLPSTRPCEAPIWMDLNEMLGVRGRFPGAKFPGPCGACGPCVARARACSSK